LIRIHFNLLKIKSLRWAYKDVILFKMPVLRLSGIEKLIKLYK